MTDPRPDAALARRIAAHVRDVPDYPTPGVLFKDITPLLATPAVFADVVHALADAHRAGSGHEVEVVAGIEARGFILAAPVAVALNAAFVPVRKGGKLPGSTIAAEYVLEYGTATVELQADALAPGQRVLLIDDVLATGGTAAAAADLIERAGGTVTALAMLLELDFLDGRARLQGRQVRSLLHV